MDEESEQQRQAQFYADLDRVGAAQVRMNLATDVYLGDRGLAVAWLERHNEASNAEQLSIAREAKDAALAALREARQANTQATITNMIAIVAVVIATISTIVAVIGLYH
jgi:hypothetical protein